MPSTVIPVILCGGSGTRLWPASRENHPKQFLSLMNECSLLQNTAYRAMRISGSKAGKIVTVTLGAFAEEVAAQLSAVDPDAAKHILSEPVARNTAAAIAFAAAYVEKTFGADSIMWILPSDHHIGDEESLSSAFVHALAAAEQGALVTFGIRPTRPETGYGYIRTGKAIKGNAVFKCDSFVEKPDLATAKTYVAAGDYLWNSGMFIFSAAALLKEYLSHAPRILDQVHAAMKQSGHPQKVAAELYKEIEKSPFDKAIMEKSGQVAVVPCDPAWSDIGVWDSLWEIREKDGNGNVVEGSVVCHDTSNCLIQAKTRFIACAGIENLVIIESGDSILIMDRNNGSVMQALVEKMKASYPARMACSQKDKTSS